VKKRQANKIIRKSRSSRLRWNLSTWEKAWRNADSIVVAAVIGDAFMRVAVAAAKFNAWDNRAVIED
jgi:ribosomal protein L18E